MGSPVLVTNSFAVSKGTSIEGFSRESDFTVGIHHATLSAAPLTPLTITSPPPGTLVTPGSPLAGALSQLQRRPAALLSDKSVDNSGHVVPAGAMTHHRCCWRGCCPQSRLLLSSKVRAEGSSGQSGPAGFTKAAKKENKQKKGGKKHLTAV